MTFKKEPYTVKISQFFIEITRLQIFERVRVKTFVLNNFYKKKGVTQQNRRKIF